jgi:hypothetical protein
MTSNGYWKPMGIEEPVVNTSGNKVGVKKYFVFFVGEAPSGIKTNWTMQEYGLSDSPASTSTTRSSKRRGHSKIVNCFTCFTLIPKLIQTRDPLLIINSLFVLNFPGLQ